MSFENIKMYIIVNSSLDMSKGKTASQVAHVVHKLVDYYADHESSLYNKWLLTGSAKIILEADSKQLNDIYTKYYDSETSCVVIHDAGRTEIPAGSLTCVGFYLLNHTDVPIELKTLRTLRDKTINSNNYELILAKCNQGQKKEGVMKGSERIMMILKDHFTLNKIKNFSSKIIDTKEYNKISGYKKTTELIMNAHKKEKIPIVLGGDHSLGLSTVSASLESFKEKKLLVVWLDAHGDINTPETSPSGNTHGMPVAGLLGLMENQITDIKLKPENILYFGVRDLDEGEKTFIKDLGITVTNSIELLQEKVKDYDYIHLSFDVDCMDPLYFPCTGVKVEKGLTPIQVKQVFRTVKSKLSTLDIVEYNPDIDSDKNILCDMVLSYLFDELF